MDDPPDPDPLSSFLVPPPSSPSSAPATAPLPHQPPDPQPPSSDLPIEGTRLRGSAVCEEIEAAKSPVHGKPRSPEKATPPTVDNEPVKNPQHPQHPVLTTTSEIEATKNPVQGGAEPSAHTALSSSEHRAPSSQSPPHPASPTLIDNELQEKAWALFPDLARDLENIRGRGAVSELGANRSAFNVQDLRQATNPISQQATNEIQTAKQRTLQSTIDEAGILLSRIPASHKGKRIQMDEGFHGGHQKSSFAEQQPESSRSRNGWNQTSFTLMEEGWESTKVTRKRRDIEAEPRAIQASNRPAGFDFFKSRLEGRCFNCFSPKHIARFCKGPHRCWKCYRSGHRAAECIPPLYTVHKYRGTQEPPIQKPEHHPLPPPHTHSPPVPHRTDRRSYADVVRGEEAMAMARYPGDPRARPARGYCAVTATGSIHRRRDDLINRAVVCWLYSNSHETKAHHLGDAISNKLRIHPQDIQIAKHYPEQFLIIFSEPAYKQQLLDRGTISEGGRDFHFAPWTERRNAVNLTWEFRVKVRIEGIPVHCWAEEVAAQALGRSCAVHYLEEKTRRRQRTRTFDLWAWCCDPCDIPKEVCLTVTEPDREPPPTSVPFLQAEEHLDDPTDIKRAQVYTLRNHLEWVEDLTFLQGRRKMGGPMNRKPRRELIWSYGVPDSFGERLPGRREDRGRGIGRYHRRDDEDHDIDHEHRGHGTRRHCSVSTWARNSRCRAAMDDCISSNRWRGGRGSPPARSRDYAAPHQATTLVWRVKEPKEKQKMKRVTFADPIAIELKAPRTTVRDDSIMLIKGNAITPLFPVSASLVDDIHDLVCASPPITEMKAAQEVTKEPAQGNAAKDTQSVIRQEKECIAGEVVATEKKTEVEAGTEMDADHTPQPDIAEGVLDACTLMKMGEAVQQAMIDTVKLMEGGVVLPSNELHFQRPLELHQMKAIQTLIEEGIKKKKTRTNRRTTAPVVLDA